MINLKTQYAGLTLQSPIIVSSSGLTNNAERNKEFEKAGAGAIVLKSLFEEQMEMQSDAMLQESNYPEAADYIRGQRIVYHSYHCQHQLLSGRYMD